MIVAQSFIVNSCLISDISLYNNMLRTKNIFKMIENKRSPEFTVRKLQERGVSKESAEALVAELMLPIVKKEMRDELSKNTIFKGVA